MSLRVLFCLGYPHRMTGAQRSLLELVTHLPDHVEPVVMVPREGPVSEAFAEAGMEVHVVTPGPALDSYGKAALDWSPLTKARVFLQEYLPYMRRIHELINERNIRLVHANDFRAAMVIGPLARLKRIPVVSNMRGEKSFDGILWWLFERIPDRIITVSQAVQEAFSTYAQRKSVTVYNGTGDVSSIGGEIKWLRALRQRGVLVVCCFASVVPFKGQHHLIRAVARLNERGWRDRVAFVCVGDLPEDEAPYHRHLQKLMDWHRVDNVTFSGWQSDPFSFYRMADVTTLPSVYTEMLEIDGRAVSVQGNEGFPRTHLEAMSFGLPIVGTDIAGVSEQVEDRVTGFLVPPGDAERLAARLEDVLADPELRARMGRAGSRRVRDLFSTEAMVDGVLKVYRSVGMEV